MAKKMVSLRLDEELVEWADGYAASRGVDRTRLLESALQSFRADCELGVPELKERIRRNREASEVPKVRRTREDFARLTRERAELFSNLTPPPSVRGLKKAG